jgi:hypothetical protein
VDLAWGDLAQPLVGGLTAMLGVYVVEDVLGRLRRRGWCPPRWDRER